jgi:hypothetical protein
VIERIFDPPQVLPFAHSTAYLSHVAKGWSWENNRPHGIFLDWKRSVYNGTGLVDAALDGHGYFLPIKPNRRPGVLWARRLHASRRLGISLCR